MDWCVDTGIFGAVAAVEEEVSAHLARHALQPALVDIARPVLHHALEDPPGTRLWVSLDWEEQTPRLGLRPLPAASSRLPGELVAPGVTYAHLVARDLLLQETSRQVVLELGVARPPEPDIDPEPGEASLVPPGYPAALGVSMLLDTGKGWAMSTVAAHTGATLAQRVASGPAGAPQDAQTFWRAFTAAESEIGGHFQLIRSDDERVELGCRRCPFGDSPPPEMCRFTSALAGSLAARVGGSAVVALDERIAMGDPQCRVVVNFGSEKASRVSHRYTWPATGVGVSQVERREHVPGFRLTISLQLPRDRLTVPVIRHLNRAAMAEVGVDSGIADDVELALAEACANVVKHSGPGDSYRVSITIGPVNAEIRVVDQGHGFDHRSLSPEMAELGAERGRGIALMHALVDQVRFESRPEVGTVVHLVKELRFDDSVPARQLMLDSSQRHSR